MEQDSKKQACESALAKISVNLQPGRTYIAAVIIDNGDKSQNRPKSIRCYHGTAFTKSYPYNQGSDSYIVNCIDFIEMGYIGIALGLTMPDVGPWMMAIPLTAETIENNFSSAQRRILDDFKSRFTDERYKLHYVQMTGCEI